MKQARTIPYTGERIVPQATNCEPNFASRMYHEHIARYVFAGQLVQGKTVLDVGCGVGYGSRRLVDSGAASVTAFDLSNDAISQANLYYAHERINFQVRNAEKFRFNQKFDVVTCFELIEHVNKPHDVMRRIRDHVRPDGVLFMSTPRALAELRTHFHTREYGIDEFSDLISGYFNSYEIYVENNHFTSLVTRGQPSSIEHIELLKDQYSVPDADVFVAVATNVARKDIFDLRPSIAIDDDKYVVMLERDVDILHKAERDFKEKIGHIEEKLSNSEKYYTAEIERLSLEYNGLFERNALLDEQVFKDRQHFNEIEQSRRDERADWDAEVSRLSTAYAEATVLKERVAELESLREQSLHQLGRLEARCEQLAEQKLRLVDELAAAAARAALTGQDVARLQAELSLARQQTDDLSRENAAMALRIADRGAALDEALSSLSKRDAQLLALNGRHEDDQARMAETERALERALLDHDLVVRDREALYLAQAELEKSLAAANEEAARLTQENERLSAETIGLEGRVAELGDNIMAVERLLEERQGDKAEIERLREEIAALQRALKHVDDRIADSEARRLEAFDFARRSSDEAHALRRDLDTLKRDIAQAIDSPQALSDVVYDHRHRDIVEAMGRLFVGAEATRHIARDPLVERVIRLSLERRQEVLSAPERERLEQRIADLENDVRFQCSRAEMAEAFAEDWHAQLHSIRKMASWRLTKPLRAMGRGWKKLAGGGSSQGS